MITMLLWAIFAVITAATVAALICPFRPGADRASNDRDRNLAVYRDQLSELERDTARGLISPEDAAAARNEISRRMLATAAATGDEQSGVGPHGRRAAFLSALISVPLVSVSIYIALGSPNLPDVPRAERLAKAFENNDFVAMVAQVEAHLAENPRDPEGWQVLANAYRGMGRYAEAAEAFAQLLRLVARTAPLLTDYGEALVLSSDGTVTEKARNAFNEAFAMDNGSMKARFYRALADRQEGKSEEALRAWRAMLAEGPADAPWRGAVERQVASLQQDSSAAPRLGSSAAPRLGEDEIARAEAMRSEEQEQLIGGMVEGLASRLEQNGKDLEGWLRLARARLVLGEREAAASALSSAEIHFRDDEASLALIEETRNALGLGVDQ